jgi:hypothetical protein
MKRLLVGESHPRNLSRLDKEGCLELFLCVGTDERRTSDKGTQPVGQRHARVVHVVLARQVVDPAVVRWVDGSAVDGAVPLEQLRELVVLDQVAARPVRGWNHCRGGRFYRRESVSNRDPTAAARSRPAHHRALPALPPVGTFGAGAVQTAHRPGHVRQHPYVASSATHQGCP